MVVEMDVVMDEQASLLGRFGSAVRKSAVTLIEHRMAHILATDTHDSRLRTPKLSEALAMATEILGRDAARQMVYDVPLAIVGGKTVESPEPIAAANRYGGSIFRRISSFFNSQPR